MDISMILSDYLLKMLNQAFDVAESETAVRFDGHTCSMTNHDGNNECPICFFRRRVKIALGLDPYWEAEHRGEIRPDGQEMEV